MKRTIAFYVIIGAMLVWGGYLVRGQDYADARTTYLRYTTGLPKGFKFGENGNLSVTLYERSLEIPENSRVEADSVGITIEWVEDRGRVSLREGGWVEANDIVRTKRLRWDETLDGVVLERRTQ